MATKFLHPVTSPVVFYVNRFGNGRGHYCVDHVPVPSFVERKSDAAMLHDGYLCAHCGVALETRAS